MGVIARRLQDQGEDWRHVYKSLLLLEYMSKHGPQKVCYPKTLSMLSLYACMPRHWYWLLHSGM